MINALVGRPGGGKSYEAVRYHLIPALQSGRYVVTNMSIQIDEICNFYGEECREKIVIVEAEMHQYGLKRPFSDESDFVKYDESFHNESGQGPLFIIDEVHLSIPVSGTSKEVLEYASLHRHYGHDILIITQNLRKVHRDIRDMVEITWRCIKNAAGGNDQEYIQKQYMGSNTGRGGDELSTEFRTYDKNYFRFTSHTPRAINQF